MDWEFTILDYIQKQRTPMLDKLMPCVSMMGKLSLIWVLIAGACLCFKRSRKAGRSLTVNLIFDLIAANGIIKPIVCRLRPCVLNSSVELLTKVPFDASFPSGHTLYAFAAATVLMRYHKWYGLAAYLFACLMGFSRLYLYVHFPTDVLLGAVFGILFALFTAWLEKQLFEEKKPLRVLPKSSAERL